MNDLERRFLLHNCRRQQYGICGEVMYCELFLSSIAFSQSKKSRRGRNECAKPNVNLKNFIEFGTAKSNLFET